MFMESLTLQETRSIYETNCRPKVSKMCLQWRTEDDVNLKT